MKLALKKTAELTEADVAASSVWVTFYEPDEFELLEEIGVSRSEAEAALGGVAYSDEYVFSLPSGAAQLPFKYLYLSVHAQTPAGTQLLGLRTSVSLSLFHKGKVYCFNKALPSLSEPQAKELAAALGESNLFPLNLFIPALEKNEQFILASAG